MRESETSEGAGTKEVRKRNEKRTRNTTAVAAAGKGGKRNTLPPERDTQTERKRQISKETDQKREKSSKKDGYIDS